MTFMVLWGSVHHLVQQMTVLAEVVGIRERYAQARNKAFQDWVDRSYGDSMKTESKVGTTKKLLRIHQSSGMHWVGNGFPVRSVFDYNDLGRELSPFLLLVLGAYPA